MNRHRKPREKWHKDHALEKVKESLKKNMKTNMQAGRDLEELPSTKLKKMFKDVTSIHVLRDCDLRATLEEKALSCHTFATWTAFVNKAGTLVHVVPKEGDFHIRLPLYFSVSKMSNKAIERMLQKIALGRLQ